MLHEALMKRMIWALAFGLTASMPLLGADAAGGDEAAEGVPVAGAEDGVSASSDDPVQTTAEPPAASAEVAPSMEEAPAAAAKTLPPPVATAPSGAPAVAAPPGAVPAAGSVGNGSNPDRIADGSRVSVRDGDFSLTPPKGWEVYEHLADLTLLMQVPHTPHEKYQRTIQVASFAGARYIDEVTAKEYEEVITRKFSAASLAVEGYRIRNHMTIEMADQRQGLLFYTEFSMEGVNLMQAHILVSSASRHYLMTYTDVAEHFESEGASQFLTEAWDSMISVQLGSPTPARFAAVGKAAVAAVALVLLAVVGVFARRYFAGRGYREYADGGDELASEDASSSAATSLSGDASALSGLASMHADDSAISSQFTSLPATQMPSEKPRHASEVAKNNGKKAKKRAGKYDSVYSEAAQELPDDQDEEAV